jgi:hypothetical protein
VQAVAPELAIRPTEERRDGSTRRFDAALALLGELEDLAGAQVYALFELAFEAAPS